MKGSIRSNCGEVIRRVSFTTSLWQQWARLVLQTSEVFMVSHFLTFGGSMQGAKTHFFWSFLSSLNILKMCLAAVLKYNLYLFEERSDDSTQYSCTKHSSQTHLEYPSHRPRSVLLYCGFVLLAEIFVDAHVSRLQSMNGLRWIDVERARSHHSTHFCFLLAYKCMFYMVLRPVSGLFLLPLMYCISFFMYSI